jgi:predicted NUDIX family NTP pyrophosphohydrolase
MPKVVSAGLLMYRLREPAGEGRGGEQAVGDRPREQVVEVLLAHPGGPFFVRRDLGVWSIPKGEVNPDEELLSAARREFAEETGLEPWGPYVPLGAVKYRNHKVVHAWAFEGDWDPAVLVSNTFELEWPRRSGRTLTVPEIDRAAWFTLAEAQERILPAQRRFLFDLEALVAAHGR